MKFRDIIWLLFLFGICSCAIGSEVNVTSEKQKPEIIENDEKGVWFLIGEWRAGIKYLNSKINTDDVIINNYPRLNHEDVSLIFSSNENEVINKSNYIIEVKHVVNSLRCLGVWKDAHAYSADNNSKLACKIDGVVFDANTSFDADILDIKIKDKLSSEQGDDWSFVSLSEVKKHGVEVFHTDKSIPAYSK